MHVDDELSGAELANRPGFLRLMNSQKPRPPFQVLGAVGGILSRTRSDRNVYALKQLIQAGVRVFFYLEDREQTLDSPTNKIMMSLTIRAWDPRQPGAFDSAAISPFRTRLGSSVKSQPTANVARRSIRGTRCERRR